MERAFSVSLFDRVVLFSDNMVSLLILRYMAMIVIRFVEMQELIRLELSPCFMFMIIVVDGIGMMMRPFIVFLSKSVVVNVEVETLVQIVLYLKLFNR